MQVELKSIQRDVGITFLFVTHDQEEALTMSDRVAVFNNGRIEQVGSPRDVYERPATAFVAGFVGTSNLLQGQAARELVGKDGVFSVRPEKIRVAAADASPLVRAGGRRDQRAGSGPRGGVRRRGHPLRRTPRRRQRARRGPAER